MPEQTATGEAVLILRPRFLRLMGGPHNMRSVASRIGSRSVR